MDDYNEIICIDGWRVDDAFEDGFYPEGVRAKHIYFSPSEVENLPIIPNHRYLLKQSRTRYPWQFWMEIIAKRIGENIGIVVPPVFVGTRKMKGTIIVGALIEWFYNPNREYIPGSQLLMCNVGKFDPKKGTPHDLTTIISNIFGAVISSEETQTHWASILTFDSIIGNVDRHPHNWGVIFDNSDGTIRFSPAFDNGTALSCEIFEENFARFADDHYARNYLTRPSKARHHMQWSPETVKPMNFFEFMKTVVHCFPETHRVVLSLLDRLDMENLRERLSPLVSILPDSNPFCLTQKRLDFTLVMVQKRAELLREAIS